MTTPTGAAFLKVLAEPVTEIPAGFHGGSIGYGAGSREVEIPNVCLLYTSGKKDRGNARSGCFIYNSVFRLSWKIQSWLTQSTSWPGAVTFP